MGGIVQDALDAVEKSVETTVKDGIKAQFESIASLLTSD